MIAQQSLQVFINVFSPGSYSSVKKVNFEILDDLLLKPIGAHGAKDEIARSLDKMGALDIGMYVYP
jgi:hypothetical protein